LKFAVEWADGSLIALERSSPVAKERVRCTVCGAKNDLIDLCRICGTMLPGADKRRREGTGGRAFNDTVENERAAWDDYKSGRMSAAARSRRPASLPDAPPATWGLAQLLDDDGEALAPHQQFGPPPGGIVVERKPAPRGPTVRGSISVVLALVAALAIGYGAWYVLVRDDDPAPTPQPPATTAAPAPSALAPGSGITVTFGAGG
jgi:hypothetical protein